MSVCHKQARAAAVGEGFACYRGLRQLVVEWVGCEEAGGSGRIAVEIRHGGNILSAMSKAAPLTPRNRSRSTSDDAIELIAPVVHNWTWWSDFLQREYYATSDERAEWRRAATSIARAVGLRPGMRVIDLGSGSGELVFNLALHGAEVLGIEQSAPLVEHCRAEAARRGVAAGFVAADMYTFQPEQKVDLVVSTNTSLGFGADAANRAMIARIANWLVPGGIFYLDTLTADNAEEYGTWTDTVAGGKLVVHNTWDPETKIMVNDPIWIDPSGTPHAADRPEIVQLYTRDDISTMMRAAGLEPSILRRAMGRRVEQTEEDAVTTWAAVRRDDGEVQPMGATRRKQ